ncbi:CsgG/HfaB family protein [Desulfococcaceae bacterium HSG8]|nr:CsgG/HfaB family protein [Desulfococcaceae bacterium HSG8]
MKILKLFAVAWIAVALIPIFGCIPQEIGEAGQKTESVVRPKTLAILHFDNYSVTDQKRFNALEKGLSAMLITELKHSGAKPRLIERERIRDLMAEIRLSQSGTADESALVRGGRILGAQAIAFGSFMVLGNRVRIDTRIVYVETGEVIMAEFVTGKSDAFMELVTMLARKIADSMNISFHPGPTAPESDIKAAIFFSKGLEAMDRGNMTEASRLFDKAISIDPVYERQVRDVKSSD